MLQEEKNIPVEQQRLEKEQIEDMGSVYRTRGAHAIHCLTVIGCLLYTSDAADE